MSWFEVQLLTEQCDIEWYKLKGGCSGHKCADVILEHVIGMNRKSFFFHFSIFTSSGGLPGKLILGKLYTQSSILHTTVLQFIYTHTLLIIGQIVRLYRKALRGCIIKRVWVYVTAAQLYVILMTGCIIYASISLPGKPSEISKYGKKSFYCSSQSHLASYKCHMCDFYTPPFIREIHEN